MDKENPYLNLKEFEAICGTFQEPNYNIDIVRLKLFQFSLKEKVKLWLYGLKPRFISIWLEMQTKFLKQYFPLQSTASKERNYTF